jgi:hypothetical protein
VLVFFLAAKYTCHMPPLDSSKLFGIVHYENEDGEFLVVPCSDPVTYQKEIAVACRWVESEPRRVLNVWGERRG